MRKFKVVVETVKNYVIEVDDSKLTEKDLEAWESIFRDLDSTDDKFTSLVLDYCQCRARFGDEFIEGHGRVLEKEKIYPYNIDKNEVCEYMKIIDCDDEGLVEASITELNITE